MICSLGWSGHQRPKTILHLLSRLDRLFNRAHHEEGLLRKVVAFPATILKLSMPATATYFRLR